MLGSPVKSVPPPSAAVATGWPVLPMPLLCRRRRRRQCAAARSGPMCPWRWWGERMATAWAWCTGAYKCARLRLGMVHWCARVCQPARPAASPACFVESWAQLLGAFAVLGMMCRLLVRPVAGLLSQCALLHLPLLQVCCGRRGDGGMTAAARPLRAPLLLAYQSAQHSTCLHVLVRCLISCSSS